MQKDLFYVKIYDIIIIRKTILNQDPLIIQGGQKHDQY